MSNNNNNNNNNWNKTADNKAKVVAAGGIEAVVKAINTHINNAGVCEQGCGALMNMTANGKNTE